MDKETKKTKKPEPKDFGWYGSSSFDEDSGWVYEGGEEKYFEALAQWKKDNPEDK